jgi:hypothetical protein
LLSAAAVAAVTKLARIPADLVLLAAQAVVVLVIYYQRQAALVFTAKVMLAALDMI